MCAMHLYEVSGRRRSRGLETGRCPRMCCLLSSFEPGRKIGFHATNKNNDVCRLLRPSLKYEIRIVLMINGTVVNV